MVRSWAVPRRAGEPARRRVPGRSLRRGGGSGEAWSRRVARAEGGSRARPRETVTVAARPVSRPTAAGKPGGRSRGSRAARPMGLLERALTVPMRRRATGERVLRRHGLILGTAIRGACGTRCSVGAGRAASRPAGEARTPRREGDAGESLPAPVAAAFRGDDPPYPLSVRPPVALTAVLPRASAAARPGGGVGCRSPAPAP